MSGGMAASPSGSSGSRQLRHPDSTLVPWAIPSPPRASHLRADAEAGSPYRRSALISWCCRVPTNDEAFLVDSWPATTGAGPSPPQQPMGGWMAPRGVVEKVIFGDVSIGQPQKMQVGSWLIS